MVILKMFDDRDFILWNMRHVLEIKQNLLLISMFRDLSCCVRVEPGMLKHFQDGLIVTTWSKIYGLYILDGFTTINHASSTNEDFHDKKNYDT